MRILTTALLALAAAACAGAPEPPPAPLAAAEAAAPSEPESSFRWHRTGAGTFVYHQVWGDCDTLGHGHGRNFAWGRWDMPLAEVIDDGAEETDDGTALVRLSCRDGSACMGKGALSNDATEALSEHTIPFGTMDLARQYTQQISALKTACQLSN
jgi:hypothetical protein